MKMRMLNKTIQEPLDPVAVVRAYAAGIVPDFIAEAVVDSLQELGVETTSEGIGDLDSEIFEAVMARADGIASFRQTALLSFLRDVGGVDGSSLDWLKAAVDHVIAGDKPEDLDRGTLCPEIDYDYSGFLFDRETAVTELLANGATIEEAEEAFDKWAVLPSNKRPLYPEL